MSKQGIVAAGIGILVGLIAGYWYYSAIGCASGSCSITSNPVNSTLYGGLIGGLIGSFFEKKRTK